MQNSTLSQTQALRTERLDIVAKKTLTRIQQLGPCPPELSETARAEWDRVIGELIAQETVMLLDRSVLIAYCVSFANWMEAEAMCREFGAVVKSPNGFPVQSPYATHANQQRDAMLRCAGELGLTPASRLKFPRRNSITWGNDLLPPIKK
jgi:P27 family predicted phage terminase small subunit